MNDIDLLKLAAKAAGIPLKPDFEERFDYYMQDRLMWNPLRDDGDALRLAVKLQIGVLANRDIGKAMAWAMGAGESREDLGDDHDAATRRAIVRAAADLGKKVVTPNI